MRPVLVITHLEDRDSGLVHSALVHAGLPVLQVDKIDHRRLPALREVAGIVAMGGRESATRVNGDAFLEAEVGLMAEALEREVPVLGLCLGAQLLAVAAGGTVRPIGRMVADWEQLTLTAAGARDPVFGALPDGLAVLKWHEDMIEAPPEARVLATAPGPGTAVFAVGESAWGSQPHLEVTPHLLIDTWIAERGGAAEIEGTGQAVEAFRAASRDHLQRQMPAGREAFTRFAQTVRDRSAGGRPSGSRRR
jgi:GMP synthase (glutamine-hydrolysing)